MLRAVVGVLGALLAVVVVAAGAAWVALPGLIAPVGQGPQVAALQPADLAADLQPGPGQSETLNLSPSALDELLGSIASGGASPLAAAWATLGPGTVDVHLVGRVPALSSAGPLGARLQGRPFGADVTVAPALGPSGTLRLTVEHVRLGRLPLDALLPIPRLVAAAAALAPGPHAWWRADGGAIVVDPAAAPPFAMGQFALALTPTAVRVTADALTLSARADVDITLADTSLSQALDAALQAANAPEVPSLQFQSGRVILTVIGGPVAGAGVAQYALTPSVPQPGLLRVAVAGPGAAPGLVVAALLATAVGAAPPWLQADGSGLSVDWTRVAPVEVAPGLRLRFLPEAIQVAPGRLTARAQVLPASGA